MAITRAFKRSQGGAGDGIFLDADLDTSIIADTDDQIDFKIAGTDKFTISATEVDCHGSDLILDADGDSKITEAADDTIAFNVAGTEVFRILSGHKICFDSTTAESTSADNLQIDPEGHMYFYQNTDALQGILDFRNTNGYIGSIRTTGSAVQFNTSSDYRMKDNVNYTWSATDTLKSLKPCSFTFKGDASTTVHGFIAHELEEHIPHAVSGVKDATKTDGDGSTIIDPQSVDLSKLVPYLVKTIQELEARITALES
tara:strand:- start:194 stop:964 length:771 start_codon:yes stop_codon:yes gene_type:complete